MDGPIKQPVKAVIGADVFSDVGNAAGNNVKDIRRWETRVRK